MGVGKGEMRALCNDILAAGRAVLDTGYNVKISCEDKNYQRLVEGVGEDEHIMSERAERYAICEEIIQTAKALRDAGINARIGCLNKEFETVVEEMGVL